MIRAAGISILITHTCDACGTTLNEEDELICRGCKRRAVSSVPSEKQQ